ncbi:subtilisin-like serine protease, partial [Reticulomyxa filosa]
GEGGEGEGEGEKETQKKKKGIYERNVDRILRALSIVRQTPQRMERMTVCIRKALDDLYNVMIQLKLNCNVDAMQEELTYKLIALVAPSNLHDQRETSIHRAVIQPILETLDDIPLEMADGGEEHANMSLEHAAKEYGASFVMCDDNHPHAHPQHSDASDNATNASVAISNSGDDDPSSFKPPTVLDSLLKNPRYQPHIVRTLQTPSRSICKRHSFSGSGASADRNGDDFVLSKPQNPNHSKSKSKSNCNNDYTDSNDDNADDDNVDNDKYETVVQECKEMFQQLADSLQVSPNKVAKIIAEKVFYGMAQLLPNTGTEKENVGANANGKIENSGVIVPQAVEELMEAYQPRPNSTQKHNVVEREHKAESCKSSENAKEENNSGFLAHLVAQSLYDGLNELYSDPTQLAQLSPDKRNSAFGCLQELVKATPEKLPEVLSQTPQRPDIQLSVLDGVCQLVKTPGGESRRTSLSNCSSIHRRKIDLENDDEETNANPSGGFCPFDCVETTEQSHSLSKPLDGVGSKTCSSIRVDATSAHKSSSGSDGATDAIASPNVKSGYTTTTTTTHLSTTAPPPLCDDDEQMQSTRGAAIEHSLALSEQRRLNRMNEEEEGRPLSMEQELNPLKVDHRSPSKKSHRSASSRSPPPTRSRNEILQTEVRVGKIIRTCSRTANLREREKFQEQTKIDNSFRSNVFIRPNHPAHRNYPQTMDDISRKSKRINKDYNKGKMQTARKYDPSQE